jgi:hypothetical protein
MDKKYNKHNVNNIINNNTILNIEVENKNINGIIELISIGANVNGISNCGITYKIPSTCVFKNSESVWNLKDFKNKSKICGEPEEFFKNSNETNSLEIDDFTQNIKLIETLILNKLDINSFDLKGDTLLTTYCKSVNIINDETINNLIWLLSKGCNVNGTVFQNPLYILSNKTNFVEYINDIILLFKIYELIDVEF